MKSQFAVKAMWIVGVFFLAVATSQAQVKVGDKPQLSGKSATGEKIDLSEFSGKIVVVDFWATWCGPCMQEAPHMAELNNKYSSQGVQFLGVSLDSDAQSLIKVAKEKNLSWPHIFGGAGWDTPQSKKWGVSAIPATFVLSPDGSVLWSGFPNALDPVIEKALKEHPPILVDPKIVASAEKLLDQADTALKSKDIAAAGKTLAKVPADASKDKHFAERLGSVQKSLNDLADAMLAEVDPLIDSKDYSTAIAKLRDLTTKLAGTPAAAKAREKLASLGSNPDARKQIESAEKTARADAALSAAQKLQADKKNAAAYLRFKEVVAQFPGTSAATTAAAAIAEYEKDPAFVKSVAGSQNETKANSLLTMADGYRSAGKIDLAKKKYKDLVEQYPESPQAVKAKAALAELPN